MKASVTRRRVGAADQSAIISDINVSSGDCQATRHDVSFTAPSSVVAKAASLLFTVHRALISSGNAPQGTDFAWQSFVSAITLMQLLPCNLCILLAQQLQSQLQFPYLAAALHVHMVFLQDQFISALL